MDKPYPVAYQHARQTYDIWRRVRRGEEYSLSDLVPVAGIKELWMEEAVRRFAPGTTKSYLGSVTMFLEFTLSTYRAEDVQATEAAVSELKRSQRRLQRRTRERRTQMEVRAVGEFLSFVVV